MDRLREKYPMPFTIELNVIEYFASDCLESTSMIVEAAAHHSSDQPVSEPGGPPSG
jgi:hypothetical protein